MYKTNYVLCCWSGPRRTIDARTDVDPAFFLRTHIASLQALPHSLTCITVVMPHNPNEPRAYRDYLQSLPPQIQSAEVVLLERPNIGLSYGSFSDAYARCRTQFDFYFLMEDDYVFTQPHFDDLHLGVMEQHPKCGYVCGLAWDAHQLGMHAGVSNGCLRTEALEKVFAAFGGKLPHWEHDNDYHHGEYGGQLGQSRALMAAGYSLMDWAGKYRVGFRECDGRIRTFHQEAEETIMSPI